MKGYGYAVWFKRARHDRSLFTISYGNTSVLCRITVSCGVRFIVSIKEVIVYERKILEKDNGGGWSFLNMCVDKDGNQWTGFHEIVDKLLMLGIAIGKMSFLLPKQMWSILPGGMPYVVVND